MTAGTLFRLVVRCYPRRFRDRFGAEMIETYADAVRLRRAPWTRTRFVVASLADAVGGAAGEWMDHWRGRPATTRPLPRETSHLPTAMILDEFRLSIRYGARALRRSPAFAISTMLMIAIGIGATTAVFSVMSAALLDPLPYPNSARLVAIAQTRKGEEISVSYPDFLDFRAQSRTLASVAGFVGRSFTLTGKTEPERIRGQLVTANLFSTLGVRPLLGRDFMAADDAAAGGRVVAISHGLWMRRFAGDRGIVGQSITLDGEPYTISAVMPDGFRFPDGIVYGAAELWAPMSRLDMPDRLNRDSHPGIEGLGLMRAGTTVDGARADLRAIAARLAAAYPGSNRDESVNVDGAVDVIVGSLRGALTLLFGAAALVLLIACANAAGLVLTRADERRRELAIKVALGASRARVASSSMGEGVLIALIGGVAGIALSFALVRLFGPALSDLPRLETIAVDGRALLFALVATVTVSIAFGVSPALWAAGVDAGSWLKSRGTAGSIGARTRHALVVGQIALSLVLLMTAALLLRTFDRMRADTGGIDPRNVLTFAVQLPDASYGDESRRVDFYRALHDGLAAIPGVSAVGGISTLPFSGSGSQSGMGPAGAGIQAERRTDVAIVTPDYFRAIGVQLVAGRVFTDADAAAAPRVAVIDEWLAKSFWPGEDPLGKRVAGWGHDGWVVVGVVKHVKNYGVAAESRGELFVPHAQRAANRMTIVIRATTSLDAITPSARRVVASLDPALPVYNVRTMQDVVDGTVANARLAAFLTAAYATTALVLAVIGMYGIIAYLVHRRTREIGVRIALGATSSCVYALVMTRALRLAGAGVLLGVVGAIAAGRLIRGMLFGVTPTDPLTLATTTLGLATIGVLASIIPARRATRVSPMVTLADE